MKAIQEISKDFIEVNSEGKVIQKSLDRKKWLKHEKLVFDKYKNHSYVDIPDYLQILINDSNKLLLLKKTLSDKEYKFDNTVHTMCYDKNKSFIDYINWKNTATLPVFVNESLMFLSLEP